MDQETLTNESSVASDPSSAPQLPQPPTPLPLEILVQIFLLSLPPLDLPQAPQRTALALVCRLWNTIVDSSPIVWSRISIEDSITYVRNSLLKSGQHPIDVYGDRSTSYDWFTCRGFYPTCDHVCCDFLRAVGLHAQRWRHVALQIWCSERFRPSVTAFPLLRSLDLHSGGIVPIDDGFLPLLNGANTPHLRELRLRSAPIGCWDPVSFPPSLSALEIENVTRKMPSVNRWLSMLATCPNLTALRFRRIDRMGFQEDDKDGDANFHVELNSLHELELNRVPVDLVQRFLNRLKIPEECAVSITHSANSSPSTTFLTPVLSHHRGSFQPTKVTIVHVECNRFRLIVVCSRWRIELDLHRHDGRNIEDALEWFGIQVGTENSSNGSSCLEPSQAGSTSFRSLPFTLKLGKDHYTSIFSFDNLVRISDYPCIRRIEIDGLSAREQSGLFWCLSGPEDPDQPSRPADYYSDTPGPKKQTAGAWPFPGVCELELKGVDAQVMRALLGAIKSRSGDGATAGIRGMPVRLERIEFLDGDLPDWPGRFFDGRYPAWLGKPYVADDPRKAELLVPDLLNVLDDDAELWWRGKRISKT